MDFKDYYAIIEAHHEIQNPTSPAKLDLLATYCAIEDGSRILDVGCGKAWMLRSIAKAKAVTAVGIDINPAFVEFARQAIAREPLKGRVEILEMPALSYQGEPGRFDVTLCIGASFALGRFASAVDWLTRMTASGGVLAIGEPFARRQPFPQDLRAEFADGERSLAQTVALLQQGGRRLVALIAASADDWDRYESLHWHTAWTWVKSHPAHPDAAMLAGAVEAGKRRYLELEREYLGWAIFVCRVA
jgi:SAM-dependent methyltransferase